jgi:hypothetical protein
MGTQLKKNVDLICNVKQCEAQVLKYMKLKTMSAMN